MQGKTGEFASFHRAASVLLIYEAAGFILSLVSDTKPDYVHEFLPLFAIVRAFIHLGLWSFFKAA